MEPVENMRATAQEIVSFARQQEIDLEPFYIEGNFQNGQRWICFWRKDNLPWSGRADEKEGTLKYNMQGAIAALPSEFKESSSAFRGAWTEAGTLDDIEQAFGLVKAWLLDGKEVDNLPKRHVRRCGI